MKQLRKTTLRKTAYREITSTLGRFLAIFGIVALGVGFFSGVRITNPAMIRTISAFYKEHAFFDLRLLSSLGWEQEQVDAIAGREEVLFAEGSSSFDVICKDPDDKDIVLKTHMLTTNINTVLLSEGRLPEQDNEILLDNESRSGYQIGDQVKLSDANDEDTLGHFSHDSYTVVGFTSSPLYINFERGGTSLGNGTVDGFAYLTADGYADDYYTEIYVKFKENPELYSDAYNDLLDARRPEWEELTEALAGDRYEKLLADANEELGDAKEELADKKAEGEEKLADAEKELADGKAELDDAKKELSDGQKEIRDNETKLRDGKKELSDAEKELADGKETLDFSKRQLTDAERQINDYDKQLKASKKTLDETDGKLKAAKKKLDENAPKLEQAKKQLIQAEQTLAESAKGIEAGELELAQKEKELQAAEAMGLLDDTSLAAAKAQLEGARAQLAAGRMQYEAGLAQYQKSILEYSKGQTEYEQGLSEYNSGVAQYRQGLARYQEGVAALEKAKADYTAGLAAWTRGYQEYLDGEQEYEDGRETIRDAEKKLADGKKELADGQVEYEDGLKEYEDGLEEYKDSKQEFDEKIAEAEEKIRDAEDEIGDIKEPDTYVLDRGSNIAYSCFESDSKIVSQVARVFPLFFILVAALVCMTTMTRMVEEQRSLIGTLKALGYSERDIMWKFSFYSVTAALLGCIIGYAVGIFLFPAVIWYAYQMMYISIPLDYYFDQVLAGLSLAAALLCSVGSTYLSCRLELLESAASLLRPKAPKPGKRIFLEYVPFIWNRMKFLHKVSFRNIFRYKRRFFMMIVGISGCTALLLTGFGMKDSIVGFSSAQYDAIQVADAEVAFKNGTRDKIPPSLETVLSEKTKAYTLLGSASRDLVTQRHVKNINLLTPAQENFTEFFRLHDCNDETRAFSLPSPGNALLCEAIAKRYQIGVGDKIILRDEDMNEVSLKVSGIFENHVYNYVIANPEDFQLDLTLAYVSFDKNEDPALQQTYIAKNKNVTYVTLFEEFENRMNNMMKSLDLVVLVIILSAAGLAFIVLYNLTNINITERIREIATIKVLGFYPNETAQYVFRENIALTVIGMLVGLGLGIWLHRFVMAQIIVDMVHFKVTIHGISFVYSIILTMLFTLTVNLFMNRKLDRIDMAQSLKSVE
ncbi:MAG: FtsX-like permease family protein [Lachnospiraceae bacterium]|nr:FtsX-like permease family protein [Lachnospiraceae bacterium]